MWGTDASLGNSLASQWIEIYNPLDTQHTAKTLKLIFYGSGAADRAAVAALTVADHTDIVGTVGEFGYWGSQLPGQGGRTGLGEAPGDVAAVTPTQELISMQRKMLPLLPPTPGVSQFVQSVVQIQQIGQPLNHRL